MIVDPKGFSLISCSMLETNLELLTSALNSFFHRNSRFSKSNGYISRTVYVTYMIEYPKGFSLISCSMLETNLELYSAVLKSFWCKIAVFNKSNGRPRPALDPMLTTPNHHAPLQTKWFPPTITAPRPRPNGNRPKLSDLKSFFHRNSRFSKSNGYISRTDWSLDLVRYPDDRRPKRL